MRHPIAKITKLVRDLARDAYDEDGYMRREFEDDHGNGAYRSVIIRDGVAIKLVRNVGLIAHNKGEWKTYHSLPESVKRITAKPLAISACGKVMAVELISGGTLAENTDDYKGAQQAFNSKLRDLLKDAGFSRDQIRKLMTDNHANNIAYRDSGELCWIDYAAYA